MPQLTPADVAKWLTGGKSSVADDHMALCAAAAEAFIDTLPDVPMKPADEDGQRVWADQTRLAAIMLASRLYKRRNSANGVEALTGDGAAYVSRYDSDISRLLRIDGNTRPRVG